MKSVYDSVKDNIGVTCSHPSRTFLDCWIFHCPFACGVDTHSILPRLCYLWYMYVNTTNVHVILYVKMTYQAFQEHTCSYRLLPGSNQVLYLFLAPRDSLECILAILYIAVCCFMGIWLIALK